MAEWEQVKCKYCHKDLDNVPGKVKKQFCCDAHRKASKRAESGKSEAIAGSSVDELRTTDTKEPRTLTADKPERTAQGNIRVSKPGDTDYVPQCETTRAFTDLPSTETIPPVEQVRYKLPSVKVSKRGKDIKVFADLPPAARLAIDTISENEAEHKRRTAIAINYQHMTCSVTKEGIKDGQGQETH